MHQSSANMKKTSLLFGRIHELQDSLFSSTSNYRDFSGFMNLAIILLFISNARMFLENLMKYGLLVDPVQWVSLFLRDPHYWPNAALIAATNLYIFTAYGTEKLLSKVRNLEKTKLMLACMRFSEVDFKTVVLAYLCRNYCRPWLGLAFMWLI